MSFSRRDIGVLGALTLAGGSGIAFAYSSNADQTAEVAAAVDKFRTAMLAGDGATLFALSDPSLSFGHSNGLVQSRKEFVGSVVQKKEIFNSIELTNRRLKLAGEIAIERHNFSSDILLNGTPLSVELEVVEVWRHGEGGWRLILRQAFQA